MAKVRLGALIVISGLAFANWPVWAQDEIPEADETPPELHQSQNAAGITRFGCAPDKAERFKYDLESAFNPTDTRGPENCYLAALTSAIEISPENKYAATVLSKLANLYDKQNDSANAYQSARIAKEINDKFGTNPLDKDALVSILKKYGKEAQNDDNGKIAKVVAELRNKNKSPESEISKWQVMQADAQAAASIGNYEIDSHECFMIPTSWAAMNLKPAQNIQYEQSYLSWAELDVERKMPGAFYSVRNVDANSKINLPDTDMLRRRVFLLYALVKLREGKFDKAHSYVEKARSKLGSDLPDRIFATDCDTRQAEIFEYAEDLEQAKLTVHRALAFYEENHIKSIHYADALRCLARIDRAEGKLDLAVSNFQKSIEQAKDIFGKDNPVLAPYYFDLGKTYLEYDPMKLDKALEPLQNASKLGTLLFKRFRPTDDECLDLETYKFQEGLAQQKKAMKTLVPGTTNMLDELPP